MKVDTTDRRSLEARVNDAYRALALIHAVVQIDEDDIGLEDAHDTLMDAVSLMALKAAEALEPIRHAPGAIANWKPGEDETTGGAR